MADLPQNLPQNLSKTTGYSESVGTLLNDEFEALLQAVDDHMTLIQNEGPSTSEACLMIKDTINTFFSEFYVAHEASEGLYAGALQFQDDLINGVDRLQELVGIPDNQYNGLIETRRAVDLFGPDEYSTLAGILTLGSNSGSVTSIKKYLTRGAEARKLQMNELGVALEKQVALLGSYGSSIGGNSADVTQIDGTLVAIFNGTYEKVEERRYDSKVTEELSEAIKDFCSGNSTTIVKTVELLPDRIHRSNNSINSIINKFLDHLPRAFRLEYFSGVELQGSLGLRKIINTVLAQNLSVGLKAPVKVSDTSDDVISKAHRSTTALLNTTLADTSISTVAKFRRCQEYNLAYLKIVDIILNSFAKSENENAKWRHHAEYSINFVSGFLHRLDPLDNFQQKLLDCNNEHEIDELCKKIEKQMSHKGKYLKDIATKFNTILDSLNGSAAPSSNDNFKFCQMNIPSGATSMFFKAKRNDTNDSVLYDPNSGYQKRSTSSSNTNNSLSKQREPYTCPDGSSFKDIGCLSECSKCCERCRTLPLEKLKEFPQYYHAHEENGPKKFRAIMKPLLEKAGVNTSSLEFWNPGKKASASLVRQFQSLVNDGNLSDTELEREIEGYFGDGNLVTFSEECAEFYGITDVSKKELMANIISSNSNSNNSARGVLYNQMSAPSNFSQMQSGTPPPVNSQFNSISHVHGVPQPQFVPAAPQLQAAPTMQPQFYMYSTPPRNQPQEPFMVYEQPQLQPQFLMCSSPPQQVHFPTQHYQSPNGSCYFNYGSFELNKVLKKGRSKSEERRNITSKNFKMETKDDMFIGLKVKNVSGADWLRLTLGELERTGCISVIPFGLSNVGQFSVYRRRRKGSGKKGGSPEVDSSNQKGSKKGKNSGKRGGKTTERLLHSSPETGNSGRKGREGGKSKSNNLTDN